MNKAEIVCHALWGRVLKSGFLTCETFQNRTSRWSCSFFVLAGSDPGNLRLFRFLGPEQGKPLEHIPFNEVELDVHDNVIIVHSAAGGDGLQPASSWVLSCSSEVEQSEWMGAFQSAMKGDYAMFNDTIERVSAELEKVHISNELFNDVGDTFDSARTRTNPASLRRMSDGSTSQTKKSLPLFTMSGPNVIAGANTQSSIASGTKADEFDYYFGGGMDDTDFVKLVIGGGLWGSKVRSIGWRKLLGILPSNVKDWGNIAINKRLDYDRLMSRHILTLRMVAEQRYMLARRSTDSSNVSNGNAESGSLRRVRKSLVESKSIESAIWKDLDRTKVNNLNVGVNSESVKEVMLRILLIWAKAHPLIGYRQGMNELLAVILMVLHDEYNDTTNTKQPIAFTHKPKSNNRDENFKRTFQTLTDSDYLEHDAYMILDELLLRLKPIFAPCSDQDDGYVDTKQGQNLPERLEHIQHVLLQRTDPELAAYLHGLQVMPEMYLIRWVRLMFTREIEMPQLLLVWDAIFAMTPDGFGLIDAVCVALVTEPTIRGALMQAMDYADALDRVKHLPRLQEDQVTKLIYEARKIHQAHERSMEIVSKQLVLQKEHEHRLHGSGRLISDEIRGKLRAISTGSEEWFCIDSNSVEGSQDDDAFKLTSSPRNTPKRTVAAEKNDKKKGKDEGWLKHQYSRFLRKTNLKLT